MFLMRLFWKIFWEPHGNMELSSFPITAQSWMRKVRIKNNIIRQKTTKSINISLTAAIKKKTSLIGLLIKYEENKYCWVPQAVGIGWFYTVAPEVFMLNSWEHHISSSLAAVAQSSVSSSPVFLITEVCSWGWLCSLTLRTEGPCGTPYTLQGTCVVFLLASLPVFTLDFIMTIWMFFTLFN